ncbi:MAG: alanine racemase [Betaproteobacteria bacterium]|nr:alanine racemase [Betaproteobacteria bacterium]
MPRPIIARIDQSALLHNYSVAKNIGKRTRLWAVVKANAYGHGLMRVVDALRGRADGFALLDIEEAALLRESGIRQPILLLEGVFEWGEFRRAAELGLTVTIHCFEQLRFFADITLPVRIPIYVKFNTGMNRLGFRIEDLPRLQQEIEKIDSISSVTLMTHFADADGEGGLGEQLELFKRMAESWKTGRTSISLANSAALLRFPQTRRGWARPGIMLYGSSPFARRSAARLDLRPAMNFSSELLAVQRIEKGERVGYGGIYTAAKPMRIGIVACGYADGYPRHAPGDNERGTPILVCGKRTRTIGRVSMDMIACDVTDIPEAGPGSPVVLWGEGMPAEEVAAAAGTITYELFCALAPRVPVAEIPLSSTPV